MPPKRNVKHPGNSAQGGVFQQSRSALIFCAWFVGVAFHRFGHSFVIFPSSQQRQYSTSPLLGVNLKHGSHLDWFVVEEYPPVPTDGLATLLRRTDDTNTIVSYCQRLQVTETNLTVPIALMILDANQFSSLSKARKACRQGKIIWKKIVKTEHLSVENRVNETASPSTALVGDRVFPRQESQQTLARRETRQALKSQSTESRSPLKEAKTLSEYDIPSLVRPPFELSVIYEDDFMAIVDKPAGVLVYPEAGKGRNNILFALPYFLKRPSATSAAINMMEDTILERPVPVHRLDFATSGLLVIAKTKMASRYLAEQFEFRKARKTYTAMVYGVPRPDDGWESLPVSQRTNDIEILQRIRQPEQSEGESQSDVWNLADCFLEGKRCTTRWKVLASYNYFMHDNSAVGFPMPISMVEMRPSTGRYHQLRRQMAFLYNTPIVGDPIYAKDYVERTFSNTTTLNRYHRGLMLCSNALEISHPFYNTMHEKRQWMEQSASAGETTALSLYEDSMGTVIVNVTVPLPQKFEKFCTAMEKMTRHVTSYGGGSESFSCVFVSCGRLISDRNGSAPQLSLEASATPIISTEANKNDVESTDIVICGGGPTGLLSAIMLSQKFPNFQIQLYDEQPFPPPLPTDASVWGSTNLDRYYLIGLGGRGITSLRQFGVWEEVQEVAVPVPGRKDWNGKGPNTQPVETFKTERKFVTQVLPRDKLVSVLYHHIINGQSQAKQQSAEDANVAPSYPNVVVNYGFQVKPVNIDCSDGKVIVCSSDIRTVENTSNKYLSASLVIAADGSARTFANAIQEHDSTQRTDDSDALRVVRYEDDNQKVFKNIAFRIPEQWRNDMNYAVRTGRVIFDALPANDQRDYVGVLLLSKDDGMARPNVDAKAFHEFLKDEIPQFVNFLDFTTIAKVAKRAPSPLPMFRYVTPRMHHGDGRIVLLGDCAHSVKPYFGMGANSALEDVKLLSHCIDERRGSKSNSAIDETETLKLAVRGFSMTRSPDIETLVKVSHSLDRPGAAGIVSFLIPIILDGIFSKILPDFFAPNIISMLQNEEVTFQQAAARKRLDRFGQGVVLTVAVASIQNILGFVLQQP